jgi:RNA polymerase sigma-70 factor (ECF subfamily)
VAAGDVDARDDEARRLEDADTAELVARIQEGGRQEFADLYERYFDRVYGYLRLVLRHSHEAEDATQEVFVKAFQSLSDYEARGRPFRAWLFTIARNHGVSLLRKHKEVAIESEEMDVRLERENFSAGPDELRWVTDKDFLVLIERLPVAQRQVIALRFMLDLKNAEIAEILEKEPNAIRALQHRAIANLKNRLAHRREPPTQHRRQRMRSWPKRAVVLRSRRFALH